MRASERTTTAAWIALAFTASVAHAAPTVGECIAANERAISLRNEHRLIAARVELLTCASADCPDEIREECVRSVSELNHSLPTIVFDAKDVGGSAVVFSRVTVDGQIFADWAQGVALEIDPGAHTFVFEARGLRRLEQRIVILEGAKNLRQVVVFEPIEVERSDGGRAALPIIGWASLGVGIVGFGMGVGFALARSGKLSDAHGVCPNGQCPSEYTDSQLRDAQARSDALTHDARRYGTLATIGFVAGGLICAGGLALVLIASGEHADKVALVPAIAPGYQGITVMGQL